VGINTTSTTDVKYHVVVDNFTLNGVAKKYEYDVNIINP
jgi:LysM repeat protein